MMTDYVLLFWTYILLLVLTTKDVTSQIPDFTFTCGSNGLITSITEQNGLDPKKITIQMDDDTYCHYSEDDCKLENNNKKTKLHVVIQADTKKLLFGGVSQNVQHYNIKCKDEYDVSVAAGAFMVSPSATPPILPVANTFKPPPTFALKLKRKDSTELVANSHVTIGQELTLEMSSLVYTLYPKQCKAINGDNPIEEVIIWTNGTSDSKCSTFDTAITIEKWKKNTTKNISITIYAFQFTKSPNVIISCSAHLCPSSEPSCSTSCINSARRRRRSSHIIKKEQPITRTEEAHVSFRVVSENLLHNQANALSVRFTVLITAIMFGERLTLLL